MTGRARSFWYRKQTARFGLCGLSKAPHGQNPRPHTAYAAAYLDDIIIYSQDWAAAYGALREVLRALRGRGANGQPKEVCDWAGGGSLSGVPLGSRAGASPN